MMGLVSMVSGARRLREGRLPASRCKRRATGVLCGRPPRRPQIVQYRGGKGTAVERISAMPFFDVQKRLGLNLDQWMTIQSAEQPHKIPGRCHAFEKEWIECAHGIGGIRAEKECKIEFDDFVECLLRQKTMKRLSAIKRQRDKLIKEGKYTPPPHHLGKEDPRP